MTRLRIASIILATIIGGLVLAAACAQLETLGRASAAHEAQP